MSNSLISIDASSRTGPSKNGRPFGSKASSGRYWGFREGGRYFYCHRRVWELANGPIPEGMTVDHINRDGLDNRLENLRLATQTQQIRNRKASWGEVPYKWVQRGAAKGSYRARWMHPSGAFISVGTYGTPYEAHLAALASRLEHLWDI